MLAVMEASATRAIPPAEPEAFPGPLRVVATDDLRRSRLTVFFRLLLALPHLVVLSLWTAVMFFVAVANWFAVLFTARPIAEGLIARYLRYYTHVSAYLHLGANPFPGFAGDEGSYPVDLEIRGLRPQNRWTAAFRLVLAIPAILLCSVLGSGAFGYASGILVVAALLAWFVSLFLGRIAQGLRDLIVYAIGYLAQAGAYLLLLSDRYPSSDPLLPRYAQAAPGHPVRLTVGDDLRRSRLTVFFRLLLVLPHVVWLYLWGIVALFAVIANWFVTLIAGQPADPLHRFVGAYLRYATHVSAFGYLIANPFPGFTGAPGSYPIDLRLPPAERQNRWKTGFRLILAVPALLVAGALGNALGLVAVFGWFVGVILGRMPLGLRNLGVFALRYTVQSWAYLALVTDRYPFAGPSLELLPEPAPAQQTA